jgi:hypothetical protein
VVLDKIPSLKSYRGEKNLTHSLLLERPLSEVLINVQVRIPTFKAKLAQAVPDTPPTSVQTKSPESFPEMEAELMRILGLDLAGDFRPVKVPRWDGGDDVRIGYKLTACSAATNHEDVAGLLSKNVRPVLVALRDRINDTIDRIPTGVNS